MQSSGTFIESISIPPSVLRIGKEVFQECNRLKEINFTKDSQLKIIEENAFANSVLESISIPPHVIKICSGVFFSLEKRKYNDLSNII